MQVDAKVLEAVALLQQAGRMDLLKDEAFAPGRPARRASAGVAAAVAACSPPRAERSQVRGGSQGAEVKGVSGAGKGRAGRRARRPASPRASPEVRASWEPARPARAGPWNVARPQGRGVKKPGALQMRAAGKGEGQKGMKGRRGTGALHNEEESGFLDRGRVAGLGRLGVKGEGHRSHEKAPRRGQPGVRWEGR
ncbi:hypothetical protein NDU88_008581 [Pleurodeles waltl]|uniref:Uncharacterized protein n=1 Tax=Pleurodeles waltl TaxID=8319 RepID=A0AAV7PTB5_PLEWA|nr:hypothetical protein NDU88_008581 [Pleurodeles waltl]